MGEQLIELQTAKLAKEKKFDVYCKVGFIEQLEDKNCPLIEPGIEVDYLWEPSFEEPEYYWQAVLDMDQPKIKYYSRPSQSLLQKWLREKHNILLTILPWKYHKDDVNDEYRFRPMIIGKKTWEEFRTYEEALEKGLFEALKLI